MKEWLVNHQWCRFFVITLKFKIGDDHSALKDVKNLMAKSKATYKLTCLENNGNEVTCYGYFPDLVKEAGIESDHDYELSGEQEEREPAVVDMPPMSDRVAAANLGSIRKLRKGLGDRFRAGKEAEEDSTPSKVDPQLFNVDEEVESPKQMEQKEDIVKEEKSEESSKEADNSSKQTTTSNTARRFIGGGSRLGLGKRK